jgi:hypothetical protein
MAALVASVGAKQYVYPAKGQTPAQQNSDESACYTWSLHQFSFDKARATCLEGKGYTVK